MSIGELVGVDLGTNYAQNFDLNVHLRPNVHDVAPPTIKLSDANVMHHCCLVAC